MKNLFVVCFILLTSFSKSQSWCLPGSVWHYSYGAGAASAYARLSYERDSLFGGTLYNVVKIVREGVSGNASQPHHFKDSNVIFMRLNNGVVHIGLDTLYSMSFATGTKWRLPLSGGNRCPSVVTCIDTGRISLQGIPVKFMKVTVNKSGLNGPNVMITDTIIDKIGFLNSYAFMVDAAWCYNDDFTMWGGALRCFSSNTLNYRHNYNIICNYFFRVGLAEINKNNSVYIYPNPCDAKVFIQAPLATALSVHITDIEGKLVHRFESAALDKLVELDVGDLNSGVYFIRVVDGNNYQYPRKKLVVLQQP